MYLGQTSHFLFTLYGLPVEARGAGRKVGVFALVPKGYPCDGPNDHNRVVPFSKLSLGRVSTLIRTVKT
jgi:hypothetical protein